MGTKKGSGYVVFYHSADVDRRATLFCVLRVGNENLFLIPNLLWFSKAHLCQRKVTILMSNPRLSDDLHKLRGTRPTPRTEPAQANDEQGTPQKPAWLSAAASEEWDRIIPLLEQRGSITAADGMVITIYAESVARYQAGLKALDEKGLEVTVTRLDSNGQAHEVTKPNPAIKLVQDTEKVIRQSLVELGLTPRSRERIKPAAEKPESGSLLDRLRSGTIGR